MKNQNKIENNASDSNSETDKTKVNSPNRRRFIGQVTAALAGSVVLGRAASASAQNANLENGLSAPAAGSDPRVQQAYALRVNAATKEAHIAVPPHTTNGDEERYPDKSGTYTKGLLQDGIDLVNLQAYRSFRKAINSGKFSDWENIITGGTRTENGPLGGRAFALEGSDDVQFGNAPSPANQINQIVVPPAPALASATYGTELIELYWASLLRDVAFTDYNINPTAIQAAAELDSQPTYLGPRDNTGHVTPDLLFRGTYPGDTVGPYGSQFQLIPTFLGSQALSQQLNSYLAGQDFMTDPFTYQQVQNGIDSGAVVQLDPVPRYISSGRDFSTFTRQDVLFQAYFVAFLVLAGIHAPPNPGNPYNGSTKQNGFGTFGGPDAAATLGGVARHALNSVWYQKWWIHLRHRPEAGGAVTRQILSGFGNTLDGHVNSNVVNSQAVQASFNKYGDYFLSQAFPEGSPAHPAYPTGHGAVAGACITVLKFFFDGNFVFPNPVVPTDDGQTLLPYTGGDAGQITVNGELNKLANNVSFGHGIHAGIHWRTDTSSSIQLGEAVAISMLQDRAYTYAEPFTINITKIDGSIATISNQ
ncbi:MAG: phosphoesterase [Chthoniobacterales bacterium]|nr:phosphoesterase [Chthoniobacterales bacterium]